MTGVKSVAVVRALPGLGDLLCTVPALRALRAAHPDARVTLVGLPAAGVLAGRFPGYVDELLAHPGWPGLPELPVEPSRITAFLAEAQARRFDLALQLHGSGGASNAFAVLLGARHTAGFFPAGGWCPDPDRFLPWVEQEPESARLVRLLEHLGIPGQGQGLEFPVTEADRAELTGVGVPDRPYACIHPGASIPERRWDLAGFAAVAGALRERGLAVVGTGTAAERPLTAALGADADLAGRTSIGGLAALLRGSRALVCNDTGVSHLAAALGTPSVVVFGAADPRRWGPLDRSRHRVVGGPGTQGATVQDVLRELDALLGAA